MTSPACPPAPDASASPPFASANDLSVFNLTAILRARWFLDRSHLASNVVSAQCGPNSNIDWVKFAPPFHSHLIKCATALLSPQLCSMKRLKGVLFAYVLEVLNLPVSTLAQFKRKTLSKKVCPWLDPAFKPPPPAGRSAAAPTVRSRASPAVPSPAPVSPILAVGSIAMACNTPPPSSPLPSPHAQGLAPSASPAPRVLDVATLEAFCQHSLAPSSSPSPSSRQAPSKCPASPLSPPQHPVPCARGPPGSPPNPSPLPPSCTCHSHGWALCKVHLTWDSSPLQALPHTLATSSPPFVYSTALHPGLKAQVSDCPDCSWDHIDHPNRHLHLCWMHFSAFSSSPRPLPPGTE